MHLLMPAYKPNSGTSVKSQNVRKSKTYKIALKLKSRFIVKQDKISLSI